MDDCTAIVEFNQQSIPSQPNECTGMIIVVDDNDPSVVVHEPHCIHNFSIREYVAQVKERDPNLCDPFSRNDNDVPDSIEEPLLMLPPPIEVPNLPRLDSVEFIPYAIEVSTSSTANEEQEVPVMTAPTVSSSDRKGKGKAYPEDDLLPPIYCENVVSRADETRGEKARLALPDLNECTEELSDDDHNGNDNEKNDINGMVNPSIVSCDDNGTDELSNGRKNSEMRPLTDNNKTPSSYVSRSCKRKRIVVSRDEKCQKSMEIKEYKKRNGRPSKDYKEISDTECKDKSTNKISKRHSKSSKNSLPEKKDKRIKTNNGASSSFMPQKNTKIPKASNGKGKGKGKYSEKQLACPDSVTVEKVAENVNSDKVTDLPPEGDVSVPKSGIGSGILTYKRTKMPRSRKYTSKKQVPPSRTQPMVLDSLFSSKCSEIISIGETGFTFRSPNTVTTDKAVQNVNSDKRTRLPPKGNVSSAKSNINSAILTKKPRSRKKTCKNHVPKECSVVPNSEAALLTRTENVQSEENRQDGSFGKGNNILPKSSSPIQKAKVHSPIPVKNGFNPPPSQADATTLVGSLSRKPSETRDIGETSSAFRPPLATRVNATEDKVISSTTNLKGKQALVPETLQQKTEVKGRPDIDINSIPAEESDPEQENGDQDDFPKEIVELLARYPKALRNYMEKLRADGDGNGNGENTPMSGQSRILSTPKPLATDAKNSTVNVFDPSSGYTHRNQLGMQRNPSNFLQSGNQGSSSSPRPNIEAHAWPPSRMHTGITSPNMMSQNSSGSLNQGRAHHPSLNFKRGGSADLYANDAVSAMNLLSMMQRTANSQTWDGIPKRSMILPDHQRYFSNNNNHEIGQQQNGASSSRQPILENNERIISSQGGNHPCYPTAGFPFSASLQNNARMGINPRLIRPVTLTSNGDRSIASSHLATPRQPRSSSIDKGKGIMSIPLSVNPLQGAKYPPLMNPISFTPNRQTIIESSHFATPRQPGYSSIDKGKGIMSSPLCVNPLQGAKNPPRLMNPIAFTPNRQTIIESSHFSTPRQSGYSSIDKGKGIMPSPSSVNPLQAPKNSQNNMFGSGTKRDERTVSKAPQTEICVVNRNPSEIEDPRELRKYLIGPRGEPKKKGNNSKTKKHTPAAKKQKKS